MTNYIQMYRQLPKGSRDYIRSIRLADKTKQTVLRMMNITYEFKESWSMDHECKSITGCSND